MLEPYKPQNSMGLWWLGAGADQPRLTGQLFLADGNRKVALEYDSTWIQSGFALSEDLPLARGVFLARLPRRSRSSLLSFRVRWTGISRRLASRSTTPTVLWHLLQPEPNTTTSMTNHS